MTIEEEIAKAQNGNTPCQIFLGFRYLSGDRVEQNYSEALKWFTLASDKGATRAILNLAMMYEQGLGVQVDFEKAIQLYEKIAKVEFLASIYLARIYNNSELQYYDKLRAKHFYKIALSFEGRVFEGEEIAEARKYGLDLDDTN